ncbi:hypothetical protein F5Y17DRAFT_468210 [Xylariaceae sp. FL0594]|nr:hypothetical protein F5Y17DRAFT_468210 [Xylariaceae sp. FL0594]
MENIDKAEGQQRSHRRPGPGPPRTFREHFFHSLPDYSGPYSVGTMDIEMPVRSPRTFSHIKRNHSHVLRMDTVLLSLYYPCELSSNDATANRPSRATWLPRPRASTSATTMFTKLPAFRNAKLAGARRDGADVPAGNQDRSLPDGKDEPVFPVVIFSHGLGGTRTCYSAVCGEMASNGVIVAAIEHRDRSGARSYVNLPVDDPLPGEDTSVGAKRSRSYRVDYLFPKNNPLDTSPHNAQGVDVQLREAQIEMRMAEIEEAYHVLRLINEGRGGLGSSSKGLDGIDWFNWKGRILLRHVTAMGHSFGGATTAQVVRQKGRFDWIGQGIIVDAWGLAMPESKGPVHEPLQKPLLVINSEAFTHWSDNFQRLVAMCEEAERNNSPCWMLTIKGSTHLSMSDFAVLYPRWMSIFMKTMVHPRRAIHLTVNTSLEFLKKVLPPEETSRSEWPNEGILTTESLASKALPEVHKPANKWMAVRLKIHGELALRLKKRLRRKPRAPKTATDIHGNPLVGLVNIRPGNEVWMHYPHTEGSEEAIGRKRKTSKVKLPDKTK